MFTPPRYRSELSEEAEAKRRFSEFETAFQKKDGTDFSIMARISEGGNTEHIWIEVDRILPDRIEGRLGNQPVDLGVLKLGSRVIVEKSEIEDWVYMQAGAPIGAFTFAVVRQIESERAQKQ